MLRVALTGGIATGKSHVRSRIAARGVPTIDADAIVHEMLERDAGAAGEVTLRFGPGVLGADGGIDRRALGAVVFADSNARRDLEAILHPRVYARIADWLAASARSGAPWALADIPLLFETAHEADFDEVVVAACPPDEQLRRVVSRDRVSQAVARARIAAQWPIDQKVRLATDVVVTSGSFEDTDRQVERLCARLDALSARPGA